MALRKPPLRGTHADRGAKFTEFGGWDMPVEFDSIRTEHVAVREAAGIFDVSHMGEIVVSGPDATRLMQRLTTNDVTCLAPGDGQYSAITNERGVVLDDTVVYSLPADRQPEADDETAYLFVPNAGHDTEMHERWTTHRDEWGLDCTVENATEDYAMFALQGPDAEDLLARAAGEEVRDVARFDVAEATVEGVDLLAARTGYTGEDGFELLLPWDDAETVWDAFDCQPCGLGARDTLRIEQGFLLSGQDFDPDDEPRTPFEAGIGFVVKLDTEFVGRDALTDARDPDERFVGFELTERGVPRHGYDITNDEGMVIGGVTSGTMSPTLDKPVGLGYVPREYTDPGTAIRVVVRGRQKSARITETPFK
ncbi:glycine cleavage system aminomethyltransferase GcvT [Halomarina litorea]|uniref:glycine cleavage system aminomethyltransferase GcvT n=1 Tax=Halomarina litorea TaxID=2961595 RepID=UPI0020C20AD7|nr:glycine cleavage system aminomethyltransferase GcvT [Halomarina sp. BCD28]